MTVRKRDVGDGMTRRVETRVEGTGVSTRFPGKRALMDPEDWRALGDILRTAGGEDPRSEVRATFEEIAGSRRERWLDANERMTTAKTDEEREQARAERDALPLPPEDSEQWWAEKALEHLDYAGKCRSMGQHDDAERYAFQAGLTAGIAAMKFEWESITMTGARVRLGGKDGHRKAHGTQKEKEARWERLQVAVKEAREQNPAASKAEVRRIVSEKTGASISTLRRHTADPGKTKSAQSSR